MPGPFPAECPRVARRESKGAGADAPQREATYLGLVRHRSGDLRLGLALPNRTNFVLVIIALTGAVGAEAVIWDYRAAFALSAALSLVVLVTAVWKIR